MSTDWFRSSEWTDDAQADFEARLRRARKSNRPQYLRIKGLALVDAEEVVGARKLWQRVLDDPESSWLDTSSTTEHLADSYRSTEPQRAAELYRRLPQLVTTSAGGPWMHAVKLAQLLLDTGTAADLPEVGQLLQGWVENAGPFAPFPSEHFDWNLAYIKWAQALGDEESARGGALRALEFAERGPVFSRHPTVVLVHADDATLEWLRSVVEPRVGFWARLRSMKNRTRS